MEFNEKLQELRKQKGLTQEELGDMLYVSRTAVSKWESGRGYPNLDSLKSIAKFFNVTVDELLSCDELICVAEHDGNRKINSIIDLVFGLLDIGVILLLFLPFFAQTVDGVIYEVSLIRLTGKGLYLKVTYFIVVIASIAFGVLQCIFKNFQNSLWLKSKRKISLAINVLGVILFSVSLQPYATILVFVFLSIKVLTLVKP